jgi:hypothetical protein
MSGVKGRSGKITTPAQAQRRSAAGARGASARWGAPAAIPPLPPDEEAAVGRVAPKLRPPTTWREASQRQQAGVLALKRERMQIDLETAKRERIPSGDVREWMQRLRSAILREMTTLPSLADQIPGALPAQSEAMRTALLTFTEQFRRTITEIDL